MFDSTLLSLAATHIWLSLLYQKNGLDNIQTIFYSALQVGLEPTPLRLTAALH